MDKLFTAYAHIIFGSFISFLKEEIEKIEDYDIKYHKEYSGSLKKFQKWKLRKSASYIPCSVCGYYTHPLDRNHHPSCDWS